MFFFFIINNQNIFHTDKRIKQEKHTEEEINNAVQTASGYMTRNRLKKELKSKLIKL